MDNTLFMKDAFVSECNDIAKAFTNIHILLNHLKYEIEPSDDITSNALLEVMTGYCDHYANDVDRMSQAFKKYIVYNESDKKVNHFIDIAMN